MIDQGGARIFNRDSAQFLDKVNQENKAVARGISVVVFEIQETHDDEPCDCIQDKILTLGIGEKLELKHVCNDGRVDKIIATIRRIHVATEHGSVNIK